MALIDQRVRTVFHKRLYKYKGLTQFGSGTGNFNLLSPGLYGNITVELTENSGLGWAGAEDSPGDNKAINYGASTYTVNGQTATFENVILE